MSSHLTARALWAIPRVGPPVATGDTVVTTVTTYPSEPGSGITRIWRIPLDGTPPVPLTASDRSATKPALSPDGRRVAFLRSVDGLNQVHVMPLAGGEAEAISGFAFGVVGMRWFPDSRRLVAIADILVDAPTVAGTAALADERAKETHSARTTDVAVFRYWDRWLTEGRVPHLFVIEPGHDPRDITPASTRWMRWDNTDDPTDDIDISPDGTEVAACFDTSTAPHRDLRWSLFEIDVAAGEDRDLTPDATGHASAPRYTPDGESLIFGQTTDPHFYADRVRLVRLDRVSGAAVDLTPDWDRSPSAWMVDAEGIVLVAEDGASQPVWTLPLDGGVPERHGTRGTFSGAVRVGGGRIVANRNALSAPPELVVIDGEHTGRLTDFTEESLSGITLPVAEEFSFEGARGDTVQGWLVRPPGLGAPAPLAHMIHGGPHGTFGDTWHWRWNAAVFCGPSRVAALVNFHGSTGFGQEFAECIRGEWGDLPTTDIERATDHLVAAGIADPDRVGITGGSYGGYMVAWLVSQTDRYRCAVAHAAVTDLPGMYASDITSGRRYAYGAEVWEDLGRINQWSPAAHAAGYSTPTLVIHGERDYRVPVTQGLEFYGVLQAMDVESRLVYYPDENHWILSQANSLHWYGEIVAWLESHIG
ncbi:MAG TPA: S9 family peptidase [Acidimicrobiia bacterium]|nr:S9 family peptidase [Acidimicrobiia bacterium]